jgi:hypothetical protein
MAVQRQREAAERLARVGEQIRQWRRARPKCRPMPAHLWAEATALARELGVHPVKVALGLNYESLRARVARDDAVGAEAPSASFVEVSGAELLATTGPVVELADGRGMRLTIRLAAASGLDVAQLIEAFGRSRA